MTQEEIREYLQAQGFRWVWEGWIRSVPGSYHLLTDNPVGMWFAQWRSRDRINGGYPSAYVCGAPDPVTALVQAELMGWRPETHAEGDYSQCKLVGFGDEDPWGRPQRKRHGSAPECEI